MLGVLIGVVLLLLLIGLVVLQGMIEWGGFDADKFFKLKDNSAAKPAGKTPSKAKKPAGPAKKARGKK